MTPKTIMLTHWQYLDMLRRLSALFPDRQNQYTFPVFKESHLEMPSMPYEDEEPTPFPVVAETITFFHHRDITGQTTWMPKESIHIVGWNEQFMERSRQ